MGFFRKNTEEEINARIEKRLGNLVKEGKAKEAAKFRAFHEQEDLKDAFFNKLFLWGYSDKEKRKQLMKEAKELAKKIHSLKGWPENKSIFWDVESYGWNSRIPKEIRVFIKSEIGKRINGFNLALGDGNFSYYDNSAAVDISREMLKWNTAKKKVVFDLENKTLPFKSKSFDSVTMIFIVDYIKNISSLFKEAKRVLKNNGKIVIIQGKFPVDNFYRIHEKKHLKEKDLRKLLSGFDISIKNSKVANKEILLIEGN